MDFTHMDHFNAFNVLDRDDLNNFDKDNSVLPLVLSVLVVVVGLIGHYYSKRTTFETVQSTPINTNIDKKTHLWGYADTEFVMNDDLSVMLTGDRYEISNKNIPNLVKFFLKIAKLELSDIKNPPEQVDINEVYNSIEALKHSYGRTKILKDFFDSIAEQFYYDHTEDYDLFKSCVSFSGKDILMSSIGQTNIEIVSSHYNSLTNSRMFNDTVDAVFRPTKAEHIIVLMKSVVNREDLPKITFIPKGGGTNVTKCLNVTRSSEYMNELIISVDMSDYSGMLSCDVENSTAVFKAGTTGVQIEKELAEIGFMCGHEPDSVEFSTLGGWIATNASGMKRGRYGNIEDIVTSVNLVCSQYPHDVVTVGSDLRVSLGPDMSRSLFGSEGSLAIITSATIKIKKLQEKTYDSLIVPDWDTGVKFLSEVQETGQLPASLRMVDNLQFQFGQALKPEKSKMGELISTGQKLFLRLMGYDLEKICACTVVYEGSFDECDTIKRRIDSIAEKYGIMSGGAENGKAGYNLTNAIAYIRDFANTLHIFGDTYECTVPWSEAMTAGLDISTRLKTKHQALKEKYEPLKGELFVSYRITQLYDTGVCMYFTYAYYCKNFDSACVEEIQSQIETTLKETVRDVGASLSHHHGVGKLKKDTLLEDAEFSRITTQLKKCFDPRDVMSSRNNYFN